MLCWVLGQCGGGATDGTECDRMKQTPPERIPSCSGVRQSLDGERDHVRPRPTQPHPLLHPLLALPPSLHITKSSKVKTTNLAFFPIPSHFSSFAPTPHHCPHPPSSCPTLLDTQLLTVNNIAVSRCEVTASCLLINDVYSHTSRGI